LVSREQLYVVAERAACIYVADAYWPDVSRKDVEAGIAYYNRVMAK
jgi:undecaprenyl pyrophosphate synthase